MAPITKMRIHRFGGKEVLQADTIARLLPDAGQVLVAVHAASQSHRLQDPIREIDGRKGRQAGRVAAVADQTSLAFAR